MPKKTTDKADQAPKTTKAAAKPAAKTVKKVAALEPKATQKEVATKPAVKAPAAGKPTAKTATIKKFQRSANDTGSTAVQIAVLSEKIAQLSKHLGEHKKDNDSRMGLLKMISHRRGLLSYLEKREPEEYRKLLATLGLRK